MVKFLIKHTTRFLQFLLKKEVKKIHDSVKPVFPPSKSKIFISNSEDREAGAAYRKQAEEEALKNRLEK